VRGLRLLMEPKEDRPVSLEIGPGAAARNAEEKE
jgi:hypothetical protein